MTLVDTRLELLKFLKVAVDLLRSLLKGMFIGCLFGIRMVRKVTYD